MTPKQYKKFKNGAKRDIGYKASMTPKQLVQTGLKAGRTYKQITKELVWASNILSKNLKDSKKFYDGALLSMLLEKK